MVEPPIIEGRRDWKRVYKVWGCDGACLQQHAPFMMITQRVHYSTTIGLYMGSCGFIAGLNLDLWLNPAWGGKLRIETRF